MLLSATQPFKIQAAITNYTADAVHIFLVQFILKWLVYVKLNLPAGF